MGARKHHINNGWAEMILGQAMKIARARGRIAGTDFIHAHSVWKRYYFAGRKLLIDQFLDRCDAAGITRRIVEL